MDNIRTLGPNCVHCIVFDYNAPPFTANNNHMYVSIPLTLMWDVTSSYAGMNFYSFRQFHYERLSFVRTKNFRSTVTRAKSLNKMLRIAVTFSVYFIQSKFEKYWQIKLLIFIFLSLRHFNYSKRSKPRTLTFHTT